MTGIARTDLDGWTVVGEDEPVRRDLTIELRDFTIELTAVDVPRPRFEQLLAMLMRAPRPAAERYQVLTPGGWRHRKGKAKR